MVCHAPRPAWLICMTVLSARCCADMGTGRHPWFLPWLLCQLAADDASGSAHLYHLRDAPTIHEASSRGAQGGARTSSQQLIGHHCTTVCCAAHARTNLSSASSNTGNSCTIDFLLCFRSRRSMSQRIAYRIVHKDVGSTMSSKSSEGQRPPKLPPMSTVDSRI
jgi:hypothetical protein